MLPVATARYIPMRNQAYPDAPMYADGARQLVNGKGYVTAVGSDGGLKRPAPPPGFSLALVPFVKWGGDYPTGAQLASKLFALLLVVAVWVAAWRLGGPTAGALAVLIFGASPFARDLAKTVMSDAFAALLAVCCLALLTSTTRFKSGLAGMVAGAAVAVRLPSVTGLVSLIAGLKRPRLAAVALAASLPILVALALYQWNAFGSPTATGYETNHLSVFDPRYAVRVPDRSDGGFIAHDRSRGILTNWRCPCPDGDPMKGLSNAVFYPAVLLGVFWVYAPPFITLFGIWELLRRRRSPAGRFSLLLLATTLLMFLPYQFQGARFLAPAACVLVVFTGVGLARLGGILTDRVRASIHLVGSAA